MPRKQLDLLFRHCAIEMEKVVSDALNKSNCLGVSGSIQRSVDEVLDAVKVLNTDDANDPMKGWAASRNLVPKLSPTFGNEHTFLTECLRTSNGRRPALRSPD